MRKPRTDQTKYICPLYQAPNRPALKCTEVLPKSSYTITRFDSLIDLISWERKYCCSFGYLKCPLYRIVEERDGNKKDEL